MSQSTRPLSPHLGIYRWRVNMWQSVLHRLTGLFLCLGALLLAWGLIAAAAGSGAWDTFDGFCAGGAGVALLVLWSWALLFHLCNGIQHLFRDTGMGYDAAQRDHSRTPTYFAAGWIVVGASIVLTALVWICLFVRASGGAA